MVRSGGSSTSGFLWAGASPAVRLASNSTKSETGLERRLQSIRKDADSVGKGGITADVGVVLHLRNGRQAAQYVADDNGPLLGVGIVGQDRFLLHSKSILFFSAIVSSRYCESIPRPPMFWVPDLLYTGTRSDSAAETPVP